MEKNCIFFPENYFNYICISLSLLNYSYANCDQKKLVDNIGLPYRYNTGRKRPAKVAPQSERLKSVKKIETVKSIKWNKLTGIPDCIRGSLTTASKDDPSSIALNFLDKHKVLWGMKNPYHDLSLKRSNKNETGATTLHFRQIYKGIPVLGTFTVSINSEGVITSIINNYAPDIEIEIKPEISAEEAKNIVVRHHTIYRNNSDNKESSSEGDETKSFELDFKTDPYLVIWPTGDEDYLLWKLTTVTGWQYYVDAHDGVIRGTQNPVRSYIFQEVEGYLLDTPEFEEEEVSFWMLFDGFVEYYNPFYPYNLLYYDCYFKFITDLSGDENGDIKVVVCDARRAFAPDAWSKFYDVADPQINLYVWRLGPQDFPPVPSLSFSQGLNSAGWTSCCYLLPPDSGIIPFLHPLLLPFIPYPLPLPPPPCDSSQFWSIGINDIDKDIQISAQFYTGLTTRFYKEVLNRNGYNGEGREMIVVVNCADEYGYLNNCYWNPVFETICFGTGYTETPFIYGDVPRRNMAGALDVVAHEFSHAVTSEASDLAYIKEAGALNESFSDMMACAVEYWAEDENEYPGSFDWTMGEDVALVDDLNYLSDYFSRSFDRSLEDPSLSYPPQPDTYPDGDPDTSTDGYWHPYDDTNDHGGVHINCGVPNKMFYLLSEGGSHNGITVEGIGILNAALIMYRANRDQWGDDQGFTFDMARDGCITEANYLDTQNSTDWSVSVQNAWAAVNVGDPYELTFSDQTISSGTYSAVDIIIDPNVVIESGAVVIFDAENSITAADNITIDENAEVTFYADTIEAENNINVKSGAEVVFEAADSLTVGPDFIIESGAEVYFRAGNYVSMLPDFTAQDGSLFEVSDL